MTTTRQPFPSGYSGRYVGNNFDETLKYLFVMHQEGEGIYNVDMNERDWINSHQRRRIMQDVMGDGAVEDALLCVGTGLSNDFTITGGGGTGATAKRFYLNGHQIIIETSSLYSTQHTVLNGNLVPAEASLTTPSGGDRDDEVYADIWLKEITEIEDNVLIPFNIKSAVSYRLRLMLQIKVVEGGTTPADYVDGNGIQHYTSKLADLSRFDGQDAINPGDIADVRRTMTQGILANGGLGLTDPGGIQSAIDNTSGSPPSAARHVLLGTDTVQSQLDNAGAGNRFLVGSSGTQDALDNPVGTSPGAANGFVLLNGLDASIVTFTSTSGLISTEVDDALDEINSKVNNLELSSPLLIAECGFSGSTTSNVSYKVTDRSGIYILDSGAVPLVLDISTNGVNGLDAGSVSPNSLYHVYAIGDSNGVNPDRVIATLSDVFGDSQNATLESNLPAGYDIYKWLFHILTDSSGNVFPSLSNLRETQFMLSTLRNSLSELGTSSSILANYNAGTLVPVNHSRLPKVIVTDVGGESDQYMSIPGSTGDPTSSDLGLKVSSTITSGANTPNWSGYAPMSSGGLITLSGQHNGGNSAHGLTVMGCKYFH